MARVQALQATFTGGEFSPKLHGRTDVRKYADGAATLLNGIVMATGGVRKRPGTKFVAEVKTSSQLPRLVPFQFNVEQAYILEFGANYIRVYRDQAIVTHPLKTISAVTKANPGVVTATAHGFADGDEILVTGVVGMVELNNRRFTVANATANTFALSGVDTSGYGTYTSGGSAAKIYEIATPYLQDELDGLTFAQHADVMYIAHRNHPLAKLSRTGHAAWTLTDAMITNGPFRAINADQNHYLSVNVTGSANITNITRALPAVVTTAGAHGFGEGCCVEITSAGGMTQVNNQRYICRNVTATTFELWTIAETRVDSTAFTAYTSGGVATVARTSFGTIAPGSTVTLTSTKALFSADHVGALFRLWEPGKDTGIAQPYGRRSVYNNDMYTTDGKVYGVSNLTGANEWQDEWTYPKHSQGVIRVRDTSSSRYFDSVYLHDSSVILEITSYASATSVTARVVRNHVPHSVIAVTSDTGGLGRTNLWEEGAWSRKRGYPSVIVFHEQRLWAAASTEAPQTVWASRSAAFEDFLDGPEDDHAIVYEIVSGHVDKILWLSSGRFLAIGTASAEYIVSGTNRDNALTPSNVRIAQHTPWGSSPATPVRVSASVIFGQRNGNPANAAHRIRELTYSFQADAYIAQDISIFSEHITRPGVVEFAYTSEPDPLIWAIRSDGRACCMTYEREQEVFAWHRHELGGYSDAGASLPAMIERIASIPGDDGDEVWMVVKRHIAGGVRRYIEVLTTGLQESAAKADGVYVDCSLSYSGTPTTTVSGLYHLRGQTVTVLADGAVVPPKVVSDTGIVTGLPVAAGVVHVGYPVRTVIETLDLEAGAVAGTAQSRAKRISEVFLRVYRSLGGTVGPDADHQTAISYRSPADPMGGSPPLHTGLIRVPFPGGYDRKAHVYVKHDDPLPFTLLGIVSELSTSG